MQRALIVIGVALVVIGLAWPWISRLGLGRLPGDIHIHGENGDFYFPITTSIIVSIAVSIVLWFLRR